MKNIIKEFPGVKALDNVNFKVRKNTIHAIVGENGAGKSTLMNILSGVYPSGSYSGEIVFEGEVCGFKNIKDSENKGIVIIHQEHALIPTLSIMENMFLGNERATKGVIDWEKTRVDCLEYMDKVGLSEEPNTLIREIGVGKQQLVEIAKALAKDVKLLILDEPTASLNDQDSEKMLDLILSLKEKQGMTCIIISHKLNEIEKVADEITVIRDGKTIETLNRETDDITEDRIIKGMVGREITDRYPARNNEIGDVYFEVKDWKVYSPHIPDKVVIDDVNFYVRKGEVIGIAGLMGAGRTELAMSIFGKSYGSKISGTILKDGKELVIDDVVDAIDNGIGYVTEDRKEKGLILMNDIRENITLASLDKISENGILDEYKEINVANEYLEKINIKAPNIFHKTGNLSGGNQQKVMLARWIYSDPDVLILDEPTRGIDVGAKYEIYTIINELAALGKSIIIISSELPEVLGMSDRIYVMNEGRFVGELTRDNASQENIMKCIIQSIREG
ncbi:multiple monosaccharide ABC transporter ATP-binding protein [Anaerosalibacter sp. Marseille-P3206]|uniref:multiple monosaccharide ABC transporter ATP-binding protein n=1 Tax=Anaerosalibacter sp. Marseille-P3206 TaxID=1871005 RepID=UPI002715532D|nr:multiple monosaccharide ABC transporter ATP-binding protein [Anaerosalibacter sp. Marseille-P3206]